MHDCLECFRCDVGSPASHGSGSACTRRELMGQFVPFGDRFGIMGWPWKWKWKWEWAPWIMNGGCDVVENGPMGPPTSTHVPPLSTKLFSKPHSHLPGLGSFLCLLSPYGYGSLAPCLVDPPTLTEEIPSPRLGVVGDALVLGRKASSKVLEACKEEQGPPRVFRG